jgi:hypothetical protein
MGCCTRVVSPLSLINLEYYVRTREAGLRSFLEDVSNLFASALLLFGLADSDVWSV